MSKLPPVGIDNSQHPHTVNLIQLIWIANDSSHYDDKAASPNTEHLVKLWQGQDHSQYGHDAVLRTAALALCAMLKTTDYVSALSQCSKAWAERDKSLLA